MTRHDLPALLDLAAAGRLADALRGIHGPVLLDGTAVERAGVAAIQVMLSAQGSAVAAGFGLMVDAPSAALAAALRTMGADGALLRAPAGR